MREFVHTRDGTCRMWGCTRRATHTDLDHTTPWPGGSTSPGNLASLCRRHHRMKQHRRWRYTPHDNGDITWTSSTGTTRHTQPLHRVIPTPGSPPEPTPDAPGAPEPVGAVGVSNHAAAGASAVPASAVVISNDVAAEAAPPPF
ncbi:MAG: HNH endonuclease signature motif containing protein [Dermatophilaceae bacterium]